jgi:hypothetical protein
MQTQSIDTTTETPRVSDEIARRMTSDLYHYVAAGDIDIRTVLDMYDWIRAGAARQEEAVDLVALARMWTEYERQHRHDWLFRAFGE